ncbi:hypothetical protein C3F34_10390 [Acinetobacter sp. ACNIH2]|uniref:hypothetical protein n=1 Tax=Acinetobacter sp. ACNIH2 TaxID=1758189 RepID=UPI000CDC4907|nr:hypothetical protein [Acinetobacter sp. ACNIH2]AUX86416.1 hypothetical protein C3F34_10390 [Acinetobacter sp. ACNIH2]
MIEIFDDKVKFDGDDIWLNGNLIYKSDRKDVWYVIECPDLDKEDKEFPSLEAAIAYSLEQKP